MPHALADSTHRFGRLQLEAAGEHGKSAEQEAFVVLEEIVTPLECRQQRLLSSRRCPAPRLEEARRFGVR